MYSASALDAATAFILYDAQLTGACHDSKTYPPRLYDDPAHVYLGMAIHRIKGRHKILLTQERYINDIMIKYGFSDCRAVRKPSPGGKVSKVDCFKGSPKVNP